MTKSKVKSLIFLILSFIVPLIILSLTSYERPNDEESLELLNDQALLLSWIFSGIMAFVSFTTLFIAFTFENKLVIAASTLKRIYFPYGYNIKELKNFLIDYTSLLTGDRILNFLFHIFLIIGAFISTIWGVVVGYYTNFQTLNMELSISTLFIFGIYSFWLILTMLFILVGIIIHLIRFNKNPFDKGNLPSIEDITNMDFLEQTGDLSEFFSVNYPLINFYKNPPKSNPTYEMNYYLPIPINNFRFVIKFYSSENEDVIFRCYGILDNIVDYDFIGRSYSSTLSQNFNGNIFNELSNDESYGELQLFNSNYKIVARYILVKKIETDNHFYYKMSRKLEISGNNLDKGLLNNLKKPIDYDIPRESFYKSFQ